MTGEQSILQNPPTAGPLTQTERLLRGPVLPTLLRLSAPNIGEAAARVTFIAFDAIFVGWLGTDSLAGVSLVFPIFLIMQMMSASGLGTGAAAAIARALGAGQNGEASRIAGQSVLLAVLAAALFSAVLLSFGPEVYRWMGAEGDSLAAAMEYSNLVFAGIVLVWLMNILANILRGTGNMLVPAAAIIAGEALHLSLAPLLILGLGPFPALGIAGAALAILASYATGSVILLVYLISGRGLVHLAWKNLWPAPPQLRQILGVGGFASLNVLQAQLTVIAATTLMAGYGDKILAGFGAASRLELLQIPVTFALGTTVITMIATNLGAGHHARVRRIAWTGTAIAFVIGLGFGALALFGGGAWMELFSEDPSVIAFGGFYLGVIGPLLPFLGAGLGLMFALFGENRASLAFAAVNARLLVIAVLCWPAVRLLQVTVETLTYSLAAAIALFVIILFAAYRRGVKC